MLHLQKLIAGASSCSLCPAGAYSSALIASTSCTSCSSGQLCLLGAAFPATDSYDAVSASLPQVTNPFTLQNIANQAFIFDAGVKILSVTAPLIIAILLLGVAAEKYPAVHAFVSCSGQVNWQVLDMLFRDAHFKNLGNYIRIQQTAFGAVITIVCVLTFAAVGAVLGINNLLFPVYTGSVGSQPPLWQPHGVFQLSVVVVGFGMEQVLFFLSNSHFLYVRMQCSCFQCLIAFSECVLPSIVFSL
jgi:hypothetical protein